MGDKELKKRLDKRAIRNIDKNLAKEDKKIKGRDKKSS